ncbi:MAG TPA: hypothetical protein VMW66_02200 [Elusimicrobiales bacterium]|nr:hypothetical protein [Elusimicrobiales bacterium]
MGTATNIVVGLQNTNTIKVGSYGDDELTAVDLGYIKGGIVIEHDSDHYDVKVDQVLGAVDKITVEESMKIKLSLAEATLENLAVAFGYPTTAVSAGTFNFGSKSESEFKTLYINVKGPANAERKYTFWKTKPTGKTSQEYKRNGETLVDVEFDVLCDTTKSQNQRFGSIADTAV